MARIAVITNSLSDQVVSFTEHLQMAGHDLRVITWKNVVIPQGFAIPVWQSFQKANGPQDSKVSFKEISKLVFHLFKEFPDIVHFVFEDSSFEIPLSLILFANFFQSFPRRATIASFFEPPRTWPTLKLNSFAKSLSLITVASRDQLFWFRKHLLSDRIKIEIIPPFPIKREKTPLNFELTQFAEIINPFLISPHQPRNDRGEDLEINFLNQMNLLITGERSSARELSKCFYLENKNLGNLIKLSTRAKGILIAFSDLSVQELQFYLYLSRMNRVPLIVNPIQQSLLSGLVLPEKTGWVLDQGMMSLRELLKKNPDLSLDYQDLGLGTGELSDQLFNQMNRAYQKVLSLS